MKTGLKIALAITALAAVTPAGVAAAKKAPRFSCYRNIYDTSTSSWTFQVQPVGGNVYFLNTGCPQNGPCTLAAGSTTEIQYTQTGGVSSGTVTVTDNQGNSQTFSYVSGMGQCPYINHSGNTGAVTVNDPANGDWNAWAANWGSGAHKAWPKYRKLARKH